MCDFRFIILNSFGEIYLSAVQNLDLMRVFKSVVMNIRTISSVLNQPESWMWTLDFFLPFCASLYV